MAAEQHQVVERGDPAALPVPVASPASPVAPISMFGETGREAMARVNELATVIGEELNKRGWIEALVFNVKGGGRRTSYHPTIEAWTFAGGLVGVFAVVTRTERIKIDGHTGWEAHAEARTLAGALVGAADGMCMENEERWGNVDEFARRSMAQTRASSRALSGPLRFLMEAAGFDGTPAEEANGVGKPARGGARTTDRQDTKGQTGAPSDAQIGRICGVVKKLASAGKGTIDEALAAMVEHYGATLAAKDAKPNQLEATARTLTGGREGTASKLIARLDELVKEHGIG